ncbi:MAG: hypothetical protein ACTHLA_13740 [Asticcacaulis sp.]|uniref:hypothetical protein n=1 Tax=Asticcacaulis sp. TaxID=1872648 RepID=UPI003F7BCFCD
MRAIVPPLLVSALALASLACASHALAQDQPAVTCKDLVIPMNGLSPDTKVSFTLSPDNILKQCVSSTRAPLTLTDPKDGVTLSPQPNTQHTIPFSVTDDKGNTASAKVIVSRQ